MRTELDTTVPDGMPSVTCRDAIQVVQVSAYGWAWKVTDAYGTTVKSGHAGNQSTAIEQAEQALDEYCEEPTEIVERLQSRDTRWKQSMALIVEMIVVAVVLIGCAILALAMIDNDSGF